MYDWMGVRIPATVAPTRELAEMLTDADRPRAQGDPSPWRKSDWYQKSASLESYGVPVILHWGCRSGKLPNHKVEFLQAGTQNLGQIKQTLRGLFCMEPEDAGLMRIDLTADVTTAGVEYFKKNCVVMQKQVFREFGEMPPSPYQTISRGRADTAYAGQGSNQLMVYDKTRQRMMLTKKEERQIANLNRKAYMQAVSDGADELPPELVARTFEERWGYSRDAMITRVELRANEPKKLEAFGLLRLHHIWKLDQVEPFSIIRFLNDTRAVLDRADYTWEEWAIGQYLRSMSKAEGLQAVRRHLYAEIGNKSFYRSWNFYQPFLQTGDRSCTYQMLQNAFVESTRKQLYAA